MSQFFQTIYDGMYDHSRYLMLPDKLTVEIGFAKAAVIVRLQYCINSTPGQDHTEHGRSFRTTWEEMQSKHMPWVHKDTLRRSCNWLKDNKIIDWKQITHPSGRHMLEFWICDAYKPGVQNAQKVDKKRGNSEKQGVQNAQVDFHDPLTTEEGAISRKVMTGHNVPPVQAPVQNAQTLIEVYKDISIKTPVFGKNQPVDDTFGASPQGSVENGFAFSNSDSYESPKGRSAMWDFIHEKLKFRTRPTKKLMAKTTSVRQIDSNGVITSHDFDALFEQGNETFVKWLTDRLTYAAGSNTITGYSVFVNFLLAQNDYNYVRYVESKMSNTGSVAIDISRELPDIPE